MKRRGGGILKNDTVKAVDLFCGAGGTSAGLYNACIAMGKKVDLVAINHWKRAIQTHRTNHPEARHLCVPLESVNPREAVPSGHLDLLVASPECIHFSRARGGLPMNDQLRASAWHTLRWFEMLRIDNALYENVESFLDWGPLGVNGRPLKKRKGETFQAFINALRSLGYTVEYRILNAADYGDPTSRHRLFIMARRGNKPIIWPQPTHTTESYRTARDIIDWDIPGKSIFTRKKALSRATLNRIAAGLRKYGGKSAEPFLVMLYGTNDARSVDRPLPTVTAGGGHIGVCEPFIVQYHGNHVGKNDADARTYEIVKPLPTLDTSNRYALCEPFLAVIKGTSKNKSIDDPVPTITTRQHLALCEPFITKYYGTAGAVSINDPLDTITTKDRFGLVTPYTDGEVVYDIRFRMLQPSELAAAMSFDKEYKFTGNKTEQVKQIGNAVPVRTAQALCTALLTAKAKSELDLVRRAA